MLSLAWTLALGGGVLPAGDASIPWMTDTLAATTAAADSGKPVFVDLWAVWCEPCKLMEEKTYSDPRIVEAMKAFVPLKLDADANEIFQERYDVGGLPTTLFLDGKGEEIARLVSLVEADPLLESMARVTEGYADYLRDVERKDDPAALRNAGSYLMRTGNAAGAADTLRDALKASGDDKATAESIELDLAEALIGSERVGAGLKVLRRLSTAGSKDTQGRALVALVRAEREHGKASRADQALSRLTEEFPDLVSELE